MVISLLFSDPLSFLLLLMALIYGITIHEFAHVFSAYLMGDDTGKQMGRLTLNPLAHMDFMGTLMLFFAGFGWGRPAPYNPHNLKYKKWGASILAAAGPLSNILSVLVCILIFKILLLYTALGYNNMLMSFLSMMIMANLILFTFNLLPIPPLDGSKILFTIIPAKYNDWKYRFAQNGPMVLIMLIIIDNFTGISIFGGIFNWVWSLVNRLL